MSTEASRSCASLPRVSVAPLEFSGSGIPRSRLSECVVHWRGHDIFPFLVFDSRPLASRAQFDDLECRAYCTLVVRDILVVSLR